MPSTRTWCIVASGRSAWSFTTAPAASFSHGSCLTKDTAENPRFCGLWTIAGSVSSAKVPKTFAGWIAPPRLTDRLFRRYRCRPRKTPRLVAGSRPGGLDHCQARALLIEDLEIGGGIVHPGYCIRIRLVASASPANYIGGNRLARIRRRISGPFPCRGLP